MIDRVKVDPADRSVKTIFLTSVIAEFYPVALSGSEEKTMQIESFKVSGFRSLADIDEVPVRAPTILTGANDGGKTATLQALAFLLGSRSPSADDRTQVCELETPTCGVDESGRYSEICVTGRFALDEDEQATLGLPDTIELRRRTGATLAPVYEVLISVPNDYRLRDLSEQQPLAELKRRATELGVVPRGRSNARASYLEPLRELAARKATVEEWSKAPAGLIDRLPRLVPFSSTEAPDPEQDIRASLMAVYQTLLADEAIAGRIREVEAQVRKRLTEDAQALRDHIKQRCTELSEVDIIPEVSFKGGLQGVTLLATRGGNAGVTLAAAGAGRRRRITLAVWEWTTKVLESADRKIVIGYDEPDTHLDYGHQRELVDLIRAQSARNDTRIIVATHSLNLIDKVDIENVIHVVLDEGRTKIVRLAGGDHAAIDRHLADVSSAMGLRNSVLLHERCFLAVEGATETQAFPLLFRLAIGHTLQAAGIALIGGNGNEGALRVTRFLNDHGRRIQFIIDRDSTTQRGRRKLFRPENLRAHGISEDRMHLIGDPHELEELFADKLWAETANEAWPRTDGRAWATEDFTALRGQEESFSDGLQSLVRPVSERAPSGKPGYVLAIAQRMSHSNEVPKQLLEAFQTVANMADTP